MMSREKAYCAFLAIGFCVLSFIPIVWSQDQQTASLVYNGTVSGRVNGISQDLLSLVYGRDENDPNALDFIINNDTRVTNKSDIASLAIGDFVVIEYRQVTSYPDPSQPAAVERTAKNITFVDANVHFRTIQHGHDQE